VQKRRCPLSMRRRLEYRPFVVREDLEPRCDITRVIFTRLEFRRDAEVGAEETASEFGNQFFARALGLVFGVAAEVAVEALGSRRPVGFMPISA